MWRMTRAALDSGVSLVVFPEGSRTITGRVGRFQDGVFRMAQQFGTPIVPVSIVGSFEFNRKTSWMLRPSTIVVYLHDTIETAGLRQERRAGVARARAGDRGRADSRRDGCSRGTRCGKASTPRKAGSA